MRYELKCGAAAVVAALGVSSAASAGIIVLSTDSSDETPASVLDATLDFVVSGSTLTLTVTNNTVAPSAYFMNEIYFNAGPSVTGLTLMTPAEGWTLNTSIAADGFGVFDFGLIDGVGASPHQIDPGASLEFTFTIAGSAVMSDFTTFLSTIPPGDTPMLAAAKFVRGPGDDSAFGGTVPGPGAGLLLGCAVGLGAMRRRRG